MIPASLINYTACEQNVQTCMKDILAILMLDDDSRGAGHTHRPSIHDTVTRHDYDCVGGFHEGVPRAVLVIHAVRRIVLAFEPRLIRATLVKHFIALLVFVRNYARYSAKDRLSVRNRTG